MERQTYTIEEFITIKSIGAKGIITRRIPVLVPKPKKEPAKCYVVSFDKQGFPIVREVKR